MPADIGRLGIWIPPRTIGDDLGAAAEIVEDLGFDTFWLGGSPRLSSVHPLLEETTSLTVATAIVNVWEYEPADLAAEHAEIAATHPDRFMLGIGIGHPEATQEYQSPMDKMAVFLNGLDAAATPVPIEERMLSALGPKMLELSATRASGSIPYFVPVAHTKFAREHLGPDALLAPEVAVVIDNDVESARAKARRYAKLYLGLSNYTNNLKRVGFADEDIADGGSDRLIDAVIPHGSADEVAEVIQAHFDAGANHVSVQPLGGDGVPREDWASLAAVLRD